MNIALVVEVGRQALMIVLIIAGPLLMAGLFVGLLVGVFQAVTQIHEMTLTFIPKILAITGVFLALLPWMLMKMLDYTVNLMNQIPTLIG